MKTLAIYLRFVGLELISPLNYLLAFIVGTIIGFSQNLSLFTSPIPFVVPLLVQVFSKSAVKFQHRKKERLMQLPDKRVDPAFLMNKDGRILESTGNTYKLFKENKIETIYKFFGHPDDCSLEQLNVKSCYSPVTHKWYSIKISQPDDCGDLLVWFNNITDRVAHDSNLKSIRNFNNDIINDLDKLVIHNDIYIRLADLIFNYNYSSIVILQVKEEVLEGFKFKKIEDGSIKSEPIKLNKNSVAPILLSRRISKVISSKNSDYISQIEFERTYPFDKGVKEFIGIPIRNFINYHSGKLSIIAFNKDKEITNQDHLSMESFVDTAMVTHSLVELAIKNDRKFMQSIDGLCASAEFSDEMTGKHLERVNRFSRLVAELYGMDEIFCTAIGQVASVHDIGKVAMPHIIKLERKLNHEERLELNMHPIYGAQIILKMMSSSLKEYKFDMAYQIALNHHQMWNGKGYPSIIDSNGNYADLKSRHYSDYLSFTPSKESDIPLEALFVSLADKYDALRSPRHYKPAFSHEKTISILKIDDRTGIPGDDVFGPEIFNLFLANDNKFEEIYEIMKD
ncbi:MAG: HD domain-containing protein [Spirochaetales bacterium]|nr:HD domain-containing protein [Spirochaetales bacterium]